MQIAAVAPGVWRVTVPLPFRPRTVHAYLLEADGGRLALVDGGADTDRCWGVLDAAVRAATAGWSSVVLHVVTHMHVDHIGLARRVREASGAPLAMGRLDAERAAHAAANPEEEATYRGRLLREAGAPADLIGQLAGRAADPASHVPCDHPLPEPLSSLPSLDAWQAVWTPGHTAGHVSLFRSDDGVLIAGDAVLPRVSPTIGVNRQRPDPVADYLHALARIEELAPSLILPGHGEPIPRGSARIAELRAQTLAESARVLALLDTDGRTTAEVAAARYAGRDLPDAQVMQAIRETAAHLHHLVATGEAASRREGDVVRFWHF